MICIFTVIHPKSIVFFDEFINSVNNQSYKNFHLFLCCNEIKLTPSQLKKIKCNYFIFKTSKKSALARKIAFKKLKNFKSRIIIFIDSDDLLHKNRVKNDIKNIKELDFLVNNMKLLIKDKLVKQNFITRYKDKSYIKFKNIDKTNFIGFSNLTIKTNIFFSVISKLNYNLKALDWALAKLLLLNSYKGKFFNTPLSYYRQYNYNISRVHVPNKIQIIKMLNIKLQHFNFFKKKYNIDYSKDILKIKNLRAKLTNNQEINKLFIQMKTNSSSWWNF